MVTTCIITHREPTQALDGLQVCGRHYDQLTSWVTDILDGWAMLPLFLLPGSTAEQNYRGKQVDAAAPVNLDVLNLTDKRTLPGNALATFESWERLVREERGLSIQSTQTTLFSSANFLIAHHDWLAAQLFVDEYHAELKERRKEIRRITGEPTPISVGRCPSLADDKQCKGRLYQDRWSHLAVVCSACGRRWEEDDLQRLGLVMSA